jgi:hypothetical protein
LGGDLLGGRRCPAEEDLRRIPVCVVDECTGDVEIATVEVERRAGWDRPHTAKDSKKLSGPKVALVVAEVVTEPRLLDRVPAGHDVQQQPTTGDALKCRRLVRGESG